MPTESWFSTPIYFEDVPEAAQVIAEVLPHLRRIMAGQGSHQPHITGPARSGSNAETAAQYLFLFPELRPLFQLIHQRAVAFARQLALDVSREHLYLGRSWANFLETGGQIQPHNHMAAIFSGAFYLQVPEEGTALRFVDPRTPLRRDPLYAGQQTQFNTAYVDFPVRPGALLLFPGYLTHGMLAPSTAAAERISVSFDYYSVSLSGQSAPPPPREVVDRLWKMLEEDVRRTRAAVDRKDEGKD